MPELAGGRLRIDVVGDGLGRQRGHDGRHGGVEGLGGVAHGGGLVDGADARVLAGGVLDVGCARPAEEHHPLRLLGRRLHILFYVS